MNKNLMIGLGVLAVAGIAYYMYKKPKATTGAGDKTADTTSTSTETKAGYTGVPIPKIGTIRNPSIPIPSSNAIGKPKMGTVRNPISSPVSSVKPCGGATYMGYYKCCYSNGGGVAGYANDPNCDGLIKWVG